MASCESGDVQKAVTLSQLPRSCRSYFLVERSPRNQSKATHRMRALTNPCNAGLTDISTTDEFDRDCSRFRAASAIIAATI
jgi:hypothetical protein